MHLAQGYKNFVQSLSREAGDHLKILLETKHMYQKVSIDLQRLLAEAETFVPGDEKKRFQSAVASAVEWPLSPATDQLYLAESNGAQTPIPILLLRNVKLFCSKCDSRETYAPIWFSDITNELRKPHSREIRFESPIPATFQIYSLAYQCQTCNGLPEAFIVRRDKWNLFLEGRSPIEHIELPSFVPKIERTLYRDALIAIHGGKILAALFYLRTFIEQFARRRTKLLCRVTGDELMDAYSLTLPAKQRDLMPSLREWYDRLSEALHAARDDAPLFEEARIAIDQHSEIRRVFKIPEV
jgi:hypothetical protein